MEPQHIEEAVLVQGHLDGGYKARPESYSLSPSHQGFSLVSASRDLLATMTAGKVVLQEHII